MSFLVVPPRHVVIPSGKMTFHVPPVCEVLLQFENQCEAILKKYKLKYVIVISFPECNPVVLNLTEVNTRRSFV
jgi:hypothetical protein